RPGDVEVASDRGERDVHDRVVEHDHEEAEGDGPQRPPLAVLLCEDACAHCLASSDWLARTKLAETIPMAQAVAKYVWRPDEATLDRANVVRLMRRHGIDDYWELVRRSQDEPEWFWPAAIEDMGLEFSQAWEQVVDDSRGPEWATWFVGGKVNVAWNCAHRWGERRPDAIASVGLGEDGARREQTFGALSREVTMLAEALVRLGVREGDRVAIFLPMSPEVPVASHACAHIGAIQVPIFSGFAAPAVAQRLQASEAKVAITTRTALRRGREVPMLEIVEEARRAAPSVEHVVVAPWDELVADSPGELPPAELDSETPY